MRRAEKGNVVLFVECNTRQTDDMSSTLREHSSFDGRPVLVAQLRTALERTRGGVSIITTGYHMKEVRQIVGGRRVPIYFVSSSMSPQSEGEIRVLVTPSVRDEVEKVAPPTLPRFNINDRVDPMSRRAPRKFVAGAPEISGIEGRAFPAFNSRTRWGFH